MLIIDQTEARKFYRSLHDSIQNVTGLNYSVTNIKRYTQIHTKTKRMTDRGGKERQKSIYVNGEAGK